MTSRAHGCTPVLRRSIGLNIIWGCTILKRGCYVRASLTICLHFIHITMEHRQTHPSSSSKHAEYVDLTDSPPTKPLTQSTVNNRNPYAAYIKPAKAFPTPTSSKFTGHVDGWPAWVQPKPVPKLADDQETFDLDAVYISAEDWTRHQGDAEEHMRELLSAAVGEVDEEINEGEDVVEGFADAVRLMPHQIRGVKWMRGRETGRKFGGILADVSGIEIR